MSPMIISTLTASTRSISSRPGPGRRRRSRHGARMTVRAFTAPRRPSAAPSRLISTPSTASGGAGDYREGRRAKPDAVHVLGDALADIPLHELKSIIWFSGASGVPAALASGSVKRIIIDLKAALNATAKTQRAKLPADIAITIRHGLAFSDSLCPDRPRWRGSCPITMSAGFWMPPRRSTPKTTGMAIFFV